MQSFNQQAAATHVPEIQPTMPFRPEPFATEHLSRNREAAFAGDFGDRRPDTSTREVLAAAFHRMGAGIAQRPAFERVKDFYRASGHVWTRGLSRDAR